MAMVDLQEAVQASILGLMFAFMVAKLVSLAFTFWGGNLRVVRSAAAASFTAEEEEDEEESAPADELNASLASLYEENEAELLSGDEDKPNNDNNNNSNSSSSLDFDASGEDTIEKRELQSSSSSSSAFETDLRVPAVVEEEEEAVFLRPPPACEKLEEEEMAMDVVSELEEEKMAMNVVSKLEEEEEEMAMTVVSKLEEEEMAVNAVSKLEEEDKAMTVVSTEENMEEEPEKLEAAMDRAATVSGKHALQALSDGGQGEEPVEEATEEGNETDDWEGVESSELEELFGAASTFVASIVTLPNVKPSSEAMLRLYAYYKIATEGPCSTSQPSVIQPTARAKWNAWQKLGNLPPEEAMQQYIAVLTEVSPTWRQNFQKSKQGTEEPLEEQGGGSSSSEMGMGPVFSSRAVSEEGVREDGTLEAIHACAREGDLQGLSRLLDHGTPINLKDSDGRTPLIWASDCGQLSAVEILLAKAAEINTQDIEGQTALHHATVCEQEAVAKYLAEHGADANIADNEGATPLKLCPPHWMWMRGIPLLHETTSS